MRYFAITVCMMLMTFNLAATPAQVIIIPNAEIDTSGNLTQQGLERAGALAAYITLTPYLMQYGLPISIFAARPIPADSSQVCLQTLGPTAQFLKQPIHPGYSKLQDTQLASFIINNPMYSRSNVLICWRPDSIQELAAAFGVDSPPPFPLDTYNVTWVITFGQTLTLEIFNQDLLIGD